MKVKRLIELLSELPQGAEVVLWNGIARDVTPIQPRVTEERMVRPASPRKDGSRYAWEINEFVELADILAGYMSQSVFSFFRPKLQASQVLQGMKICGTK